MVHKITFLLIVLFSGHACGTVTVSYLYSPYCSHCEVMKPEWNRAVESFNDSAELTFRMFNVLTPEGEEVATALGNRYVPAVYIDLEMAVQGERADFYEYLSQKICSAIDNQHTACLGLGRNTGQDALLYLIPLAFIGAFLGYAYKQEWIKLAHN